MKENWNIVDPKNGFDHNKQIELLKRSHQQAGITSWEYQITSGLLIWMDPSGSIFSLNIERNALLNAIELFGQVVNEDVNLVTNLLNEALLSHSSTVEYRTKNREGIQYYKASIRLIHNDNGTEKYLTGTLQNITAFKKVENHLEYINETFEQSEKLANLGNWQVNLSSDQYNYSGNLYKIFGVEENTFLPGLENFYKYVHPEDKDKIFSTDSILHHAEIPQLCNFRIVTPLGEVRHIKSITRCIKDSCGENIILGTIQDITKEEMLLKQLEEKNSLNEMISESSIDYVSAFDQNLNITAWNRKCEEKFELLRKDVIGKHVLEVFTGNEGLIFKNDLDQALQGETIHREEKSTENNAFFDIYISPIKNSDGLIFGVFCISHDLTAIKNVTLKLVELNHSLKHKNDQLEQSNNELASFSYIASHDLQEHLRKMQTFSSRILEKEFQTLTPQGTEYFKRMDFAAKRMQTLIDDLLTFSRTNTQTKNFKQADLNQILESVRNDIKDSIDEKHATIVSDHLPVANIISFQFRQLIENLLLNALKYNKAGVPPQISITCSTYESAYEGSNADLMKGTYYKIDFKDNGIGFEQKYHLRIFELFQRLHGKSEYPGTGLGLAICKRIMQNHKGAITAEGVPDEGATFTVYLPV